MSTEPTIKISNQHPSDIKNISIEIEPSYPLIVALIEFFRTQKRPQKSLEICLRGLDYFPGDLGLRLELAMSYLDLSERDKAGVEILTVIQELTQLSPVLDSMANYFRNQQEPQLSEWFQQLSLVLSKYPEKNTKMKEDTPGASFFPQEDFQPKDSSQVQENSLQGDLEPKTYFQKANEEISLFSSGKITDEKDRSKEVHPDSNVVSTLTNWLSQLKESQALSLLLLAEKNGLAYHPGLGKTMALKKPKEV